MDGFECFDNCKAEEETDKALLVSIPDIDKDPIWVPKSQIHDDSEVYELGHTGLLAVKTWWAKKQGWI